MVSGHGPYVVDADGREYVDLVGSWGPMILGHAHPEVISAICAAARNGTSFGASTEQEIELAEQVRRMFPSIELLRMVNSGTEATMSALRLARGFTGRNKLIKFAGCYHGHGDSFLIKAGSGALTHGVPDSAGITPGTAGDTLTAEYNNLEQVEILCEANPGQIAAIIVEPVAGNMGVVKPNPGFLEGLREIATGEGIVLIFDEVMTGFRLSRAGAQGLFGVTPDLTTLGKIMGGGLPVGAYGGRKDIMERLSPLGPVYQAGTLSGNPCSVAAGLATLRRIDRDETYQQLDNTAKKFADGLAGAACSAGVPVTINRVGSMFTVFFTKGPVTDLTSAGLSDTGCFSRFFQAMLKRGILLPPSQFESAFVSLAHDDAVIAETIVAAGEAFRVCA
jgi:glutamate-1-semialdehyde 2,1-aminomutase